MPDYTSTTINKIAVHNVGNKVNEEGLRLSASTIETDDEVLKALLMKFFLTPMTSSELFSFTFSNEDFTLNPLYNFALKIFDQPKSFLDQSVNISKQLYEVSTHPQIKPGDLFVVLFNNVELEGEKLDAIGIFKSENKHSFLKVDQDDEGFSLNYESGINPDKLDKGCLIFDTDRENGLKICILDRSNRSEAQYWKDAFLMLRPCINEYHHTKQFLDITKNYVTKQFKEEFEVTKTDQIAVLNRSMEYFKTHETFDKEEFEEEVLQDTGVIKSFRKFDNAYREENSVEIEDSFEISTSAVKKQAKIFKSVLKLDKNFHIYIHGDKDLIEQGVDKDGRKYYKIYYKEES